MAWWLEEEQPVSGTLGRHGKQWRLVGRLRRHESGYLEIVGAVAPTEEDASDTLTFQFDCQAVPNLIFHEYHVHDFVFIEKRQRFGQDHEHITIRFTSVAVGRRRGRSNDEPHTLSPKTRTLLTRAALSPSDIITRLARPLLLWTSQIEDLRGLSPAEAFERVKDQPNPCRWPIGDGVEVEAYTQHMAVPSRHDSVTGHSIQQTVIVPELVVRVTANDGSRSSIDRQVDRARTTLRQACAVLGLLERTRMTHAMIHQSFEGFPLSAEEKYYEKVELYPIVARPARLFNPRDLVGGPQAIGEAIRRLHAASHQQDGVEIAINVCIDGFNASTLAQRLVQYAMGIEALCGQHASSDGDSSLLSRTRFNRLRTGIQSVIKTHAPPLSESERAAIYPKLNELNRLPLHAKIKALVQAHAPHLWSDDLAEVLRQVIALRNKLVHRGQLEESDENAAVVETLGDLLDALLLAWLGLAKEHPAPDPSEAAAAAGPTS